MPTIFSPSSPTTPANPLPTTDPVVTNSQTASVPPVGIVPKKPETNSLKMFTSFCKDPLNVSMPGLDENESILFFLRRDFVTNVPWILKTIFFAILPLFIPALLTLSRLSLDFVPIRIQILVLSFYYLILVGYALASFLTWFYTIGVITSKQAFDIDFTGLSSINVGSVKLSDSADAKYVQQGFFQSFFDYGDITITIEATKEKFVFEKTPQPAKVTDILNDLIGGTH